MLDIFTNCANLWLPFADNEEIARELEELYGDIDALEFYPGLMLERTRPGTIFGESMVEMGAPFSLKGLLGNPICSPMYWKPSTFGGQVGFNIVNSATLKKLVCLNMKTCPYVAFSVPTKEKSQRGSDDSKVGTDELWPFAGRGLLLLRKKMHSMCGEHTVMFVWTALENHTGLIQEF